MGIILGLQAVILIMPIFVFVARAPTDSSERIS
jgi:hypothetical protein